MDRPEHWTTHSLDVLRLHLGSFQCSDESDKIITMEPKWTYSIFGDSEKIFGFQDLKIDLSFASDSLVPLLEINYSAQIPTSLGVEAEDLDGTLSEFLPLDTYRDRSKWQEKCRFVSRSFKPVGLRTYGYSVDGVKYSIFKCSRQDANFEESVSRMQILSILYIEAASMIDLEDERFEVWTLYKELEDDAGYAFVGYCTCYKFHFYDRIQHDLEHLRYRISQFLILPCYQSKGHGGRLYDAIMDQCLLHDRILELTVEDPSEAFDDLRDRRDLVRLRDNKALPKDLQLLSVQKDLYKETQRVCKLASRQFARLMEMRLLQQMDKRDKAAQKVFRLLVKKRLYKKNLDVLAAMNSTERLQKLEETYQAQVEDYRRLLASLTLNSIVQGNYEETGNEEGKHAKKRQKIG